MSFNFPVFKTKVDGSDKAFLLEDPVERQKYFTHKAGDEIEKIRGFLEKNSFMAFLLGPKNSGKGTYSKLFTEAVGKERVYHLSVGDAVRNIHKSLEDGKKREEIVSFIREKYRGFMPVDEAIQAVLDRDTKTLLPTELILTFLEWELSQVKGKAIFVDGFPRNLDQISYSLYFRSLMGYQDNPDFFVFIDVPETIIDERMKNRVICPKCQTPRNPKLLKTKDVGYDAEAEEFYLMCDDPECGKARMVAKEGDELGIEAIRERIDKDKKIMKTLLDLQGVPKIYLRNAVPVDVAKERVDDYEITPMYRYELDSSGEVKTVEEPWVVPDEEGTPSYSLLPAAVVISLIKQIKEVLEL